MTLSIILLIAAALASIGASAAGGVRWGRGRPVNWLYVVVGIGGVGVCGIVMALDHEFYGDFAPLAGWLLGVVVVGAIAIALLTRGFRTRAIGRHPHCRACGFDLTGKPADSNLCSECGADLTLPDAITLGHMHHTRSLFAAGVLCVLLILGGTAIGVAQSYRSGAYIPWMPSNVLFRLADQRNPRASSIVSELCYRMQSDRFTQAQTLRLIQSYATNPSYAAAAGPIAMTFRRQSMTEPTLQAILALPQPVTGTIDHQLDRVTIQRKLAAVESWRVDYDEVIPIKATRARFGDAEIDPGKIIFLDRGRSLAKNYRIMGSFDPDVPPGTMLPVQLDFEISFDVTVEGLPRRVCFVIPMRSTLEVFSKRERWAQRQLDVIQPAEVRLAWHEGKRILLLRDYHLASMPIRLSVIRNGQETLLGVLSSKDPEHPWLELDKTFKVLPSDVLVISSGTRGARFDHVLQLPPDSGAP